MKSINVAATAILGILAGAAWGGAQHPATPSVAEPGGAKDGCGNHPPGACAAAAEAKTPTASTEAPLAIARTQTIRPGEHFEIGLTFAETTSAKATFKASGALSWNVHSHTQGQTTVHQKGSAAEGDIAFGPTAAGSYSFMWTNDGTAPVTIDAKISAARGVTERTH